MISVFILVLASSSFASITPPQYYMNEWIVRTTGGREEAQLLALQYGFKFTEEVLGFNNTYRITKDNHPSRHKREARIVTDQLNADNRVIWVEQQSAHLRTKRDFVLFDDEVRLLQKKDFLHDILNLLGLSSGVENRKFNDEYWMDEWYLGGKHATLNVLPAWDQGITGKGIRVSILDDGIEGHHTDLKGNYDPEISYDINGNDSDPTPRYDDLQLNSHGTKCAGEVSMMANNKECGVGLAYDAKIGGVRMLDGPVNDRVEGTALSYANDKVDIYSASWGPNDDGITVDGPRTLAQEAFLRGITEGRKGKGIIFVWASGNGGTLGDSCGCDGYVNSIYTLAVSSATESGKFPWYGEKCAGVLAATYSSGGFTEGMIVASNLNSTCTNRHSGTSASAPLAAGIIALTLQANPSLTWRDIQHLTVVTANPKPLLSNDGWTTNGARRLVSSTFGFGLMDAGEMVNKAQHWTNVPEQHNCTETYPEHGTFELFHTYKRWKYTLNMNCPSVKYLEHVLLTINIQSDRRGQLEIYLTSPAGTRSQLLFKRYLDVSTDGFKNWTLLSVQSWNENPTGNWTIEYDDYCGFICSRGTAGDITLKVFGTQTPPFYLGFDNLTNDDKDKDKSTPPNNNTVRRNV